MSQSPYPRLFSPLVLAGQTLKNRIAHASISPRRPLNDLHEPLLAAGLSVTLVGDCRIARDALAATAEGHEAGMAV